MAAEGFDYEVVGDVVQDYFCPICLLLLKDAVELDCTHTLCKSCLDSWVQSCDERNTEVTCPKCKRVFERGSSHRVRALDRIIQTSVNVKCPNKCEWIGMISNIKDHNASCQFVLVQCTIGNCGQLVPRKDMDNHKKECLYREETCQYCQKLIIMKKMLVHYQHCDLYAIPCPNVGCIVVMQRKELDEHILVGCQYQHIACIYQSVGCTSVMLRKDLQQHLDSSMQQHMECLLSLKEENVALKKELEESRAVQETLKNDIKYLKNNAKNHAEINSLVMDNFLVENGMFEGMLKEEDSFVDAYYSNRIKILYKKLEDNILFNCHDHYYAKLNTFGKIDKKLHVTLCKNEEEFFRRTQHAGLICASSNLCTRVRQNVFFIDVFIGVRCEDFYVTLFNTKMHNAGYRGRQEHGIWIFEFVECDANDYMEEGHLLLLFQHK